MCLVCYIMGALRGNNSAQLRPGPAPTKGPARLFRNNSVISGDIRLGATRGETYTRYAQTAARRQKIMARPLPALTAELPAQRSPCTSLGTKARPPVSKSLSSRAITLSISPLRNSRISSSEPCVSSSKSNIAPRPREKLCPQLVLGGNNCGFRPP